jgi:hypothetical protein
MRKLNSPVKLGSPLTHKFALWLYVEHLFVLIPLLRFSTLTELINVNMITVSSVHFIEPIV